MKTASEVAENIRFLDNMPAGSIGYIINGAAVKDSWKKILVIFNGKPEQEDIQLPPGTWKAVLADNFIIDSHKSVSGKLRPKDYRAYIFYQ